MLQKAEMCYRAAKHSPDSIIHPLSSKINWIISNSLWLNFTLFALRNKLQSSIRDVHWKQKRMSETNEPFRKSSTHPNFNDLKSDSSQLLRAFSEPIKRKIHDNNLQAVTQPSYTPRLTILPSKTTSSIWLRFFPNRRSSSIRCRLKASSAVTTAAKCWKNALKKESKLKCERSSEHSTMLWAARLNGAKKKTRKGMRK